MLECSLRKGRATGVTLALLTLLAPSALAGPWTDPGHADTSMVAWATAVEALDRGPQDINVPGSPLAAAGAGSNVLGPATGDPADTVSLGDGGTITVFIDAAIHNGPGNDFAVFENGFFDLFGLFAEFAYVEVASNGIDFAEFPTDTVHTTPVAGFDSVDPTDWIGVAGRHPARVGTGFDLADLARDPLVLSGAVDLMDIRYVRLTDVIGDGSTSTTSGDPLYDPYATPFPESGFDLDAVGVLSAPEPGVAGLLASGVFALGTVSRRRRSSRRRIGVSTLLATLFIASPALALVADFEDAGLTPESQMNGALQGGADFVSRGVTFENDYFSWGGFAGFAVSNRTDTTTPGFGNQYSTIAGGGAGGSESYGVFYASSLNIVLPSPSALVGAQITNTTYAGLSMLNGDPFAKQFGGTTGLDPDYFRLIIEGLDASGASTGTVEFMLADYTAPGTADDYVVDDWTFVDLSSLGVVSRLAFAFESSDVHPEFGINTPTYFAIDDLTTVPEPGTALLLGLGLAVLAGRRSRR